MSNRVIHFARMIAAVIALMIVASGCVYYNTFFNARQAFNEAEKGRKAQKGAKGSINTGSYQTAIDKSLKVIENHPNSKYYDDALYVLGVSYYYTNQFPRSERRLRELLANYPNSKYAKEASLYLARAKLKIKETDEAFKLFQEIFEGKFNKNYRSEAALELGRYHREEKDYGEAERYFRAVRDSLGDGSQQREAQIDLAETYFAAYRFGDALSGYLQVLGMSPDKDEKYDALFHAALCSYRLQRINAGLDYLNQLSKDQLYFDSLSTLKLTVGQGYEYAGDLVLAEETYGDVAATSRDRSRVCEAYYRLGLIYQYDYDDLTKAKSYYDKAAEANRGIPSGIDALQRASDIAKMQTLSKAAADALAEETKAQQDSLKKLEEAKPKDSSKVSVPAGDSTGTATPSAVTDTTGGSKGQPKDTGTAVTDTAGQAGSSLANNNALSKIAQAMNGQLPPVDTTSVRDTTGAVRIPMSTDSTQRKDTLAVSAPAVKKDSSTAGKPLPTSDSARVKWTPLLPSAVDSSAAGKETPKDSGAVKDSSRITGAEAPKDTTGGRDTTAAKVAPTPISAGEAADTTRAKDSLPPSVPVAPSDSGVVKDSTAVGQAKAADSSLLKTAPPVRDTAKERMEQLAAQRARDSVKAVQDSIAARKAAQDKIDKAASTQYQLAELFWFQLNKPDSAINELKFLVDHYRTSTKTPDAMIALSQMYRDYLADTTGADSILRSLIALDPHSDYVPEALKVLNLLGTPADTGYAQMYFKKAEDFLIDSSNYDSAIYYYRYVADHFPDSKYNLQARYNVIWVEEMYKSPGDSSVVFAYKQFADSFPGNPFAQSAVEKITYQPPVREKRKKENDEGGGKPDSLGGKGTVEEATPVQPGDSSAPQYRDARDRAYVGPKGEALILLEAKPIETTIDFEYPAEAYTLEGNIQYLYFQILLDFSGKVVDVDLKIPTVNEELNRRAQRTVASMTFDPLDVNKELARKSVDIMLPEDKVDSRGRWYVYKFTAEKPGQAR